MKEELVSFETAKLASEKGCFKSSNNKWFEDEKQWLQVPAQSLLQRWLREVHSIDCVCVPVIGEDEECYSGTIFKNRQDVFIDKDVDGNSHEESLEKLLQEALKLIK